MPEATLPTAMALLANLLTVNVEGVENPNTPASSLEHLSQ